MKYPFHGYFRDNRGNALSGGTVTVYNSGTTTLATIYDSSNAAITSITSGPDGSFEFFVDTGDYTATSQFDIVMSKTGYSTKTIEKVSLWGGIEEISHTHIAADEGGDIRASNAETIAGTENGKFVTPANITAKIDTDGTLAGNLDTRIPSQKAVKTYADTKVAKSLYDAHTIIAATSDNTPAALAVAEQTLVGRVTGGNIAALTVAEITKMLGGISKPFRNLQASATGANTNVGVTADSLVVETTDYSFVTLRNVSVTISTTASGANGLDTGSIAVNTWYSVWIIYNPTTATTAGLISTSETTPTMPAGYTYKSRVGWIRTNANGNYYPIGFKQKGRRVQYLVTSEISLPIMASGASGDPMTPTFTSLAVGSYIPSTAGVIDIVVHSGSSSACIVIVAPSNSYGAYNSATNSPPVVLHLTTNASGALKASLILESTNIYYAVSTAGQIYCAGWEDNL